MFWVDSRLLEVVKIESWSHIEVGQCHLFFRLGCRLISRTQKS